MQLEAYNARDIDAFMRRWANDCDYFAFLTTLLASGARAVQERHIDRFKEPDLSGELLSRIVVGDVVVDYEKIQRNFREGLSEVDAFCIYEVERGKIIKGWFKLGERRLHPPAVRAASGGRVH
jgi:putative hydrolase of HD superfamily